VVVSKEDPLDFLGKKYSVIKAKAERRWMERKRSKTVTDL